MCVCVCIYCFVSYILNVTLSYIIGTSQYKEMGDASYDNICFL